MKEGSDGGAISDGINVGSQSGSGSGPSIRGAFPELAPIVLKPVLGSSSDFVGNIIGSAGG